MEKRKKHFEKIEKVKERLKNVPTETLRLRLSGGYLLKEGAIAVREVITERELSEKQLTPQD